MTGYPATCCMPDCPSPATVRNRAGQGTCAHHRLVVVAQGGSWVADKHDATSGGEH